MTRKDKLLVMGVISGAHGVRGEVKLKSFTARAEDIFSYGPLLADDGPGVLEILSWKPAKGQFIARLKGVETREAAEALKGVKLKLSRAALPEPEEDVFYHSDLAGLAVETEKGEPAGEVAAVQNFGAGDLLEIRPPSGESFFIPFTKRAVPRVDLASGRIVIRREEEED